MVFLVVIYGCESWTIRKAKSWTIDAFELWCWRLLRAPWIARRTNQSILKEIDCEYPLKELILKLQYFGNTLCKQPTHWKRPWCWGRLRASREGGDRGWDGWTASLIQWTWTWANSTRWWGTGKPGVGQSMGSRRIRHDLATEQC